LPLRAGTLSLLCCTISACGGSSEVDQAPPSIEARVIEKANKLKQINCEIKALEAAEEVDIEQKSSLEFEQKKLIKKSIDLLNKNGLEGKVIRGYNLTYMQPAMDTTDC
jgi:hypothetical protein